MADTDLPVSGKDTTITVLLDGVLKTIADQVVSFDAKPMITEMISKPLGDSGAKVDAEWDGWEGTFELDTSTQSYDDIIDAVESASRLRVPMELTITETTSYRDLSQKTYTYISCKITNASKRVQRGTQTKANFTWKTGQQRIAT